MQMHRESACLAIAKAQHEQAKQYDRGRRAIPDLKKGLRVLINLHSLEWTEAKGNGAKLMQRWIRPFEVTQQINPKVFCLWMSDKYPGLVIFNVEYFKKYVESPEEFRERSVLPETQAKKPKKEEFIVEKIIKHRYEKKGKIIKYLVQWVPSLTHGNQKLTWQMHWGFYPSTARYTTSDPGKRAWGRGGSSLSRTKVMFFSYTAMDSGQSDGI